MDGGRAMTLMNHVDRYIAYKRRLGFKLFNEERLLRRYVTQAAVHGDQFLRTARMLEWAGTARSPSTVRNRLDALRGFAVWLHAEDQRHQIPARHLGPANKRRPAPRLMTRGEIQRLLNAALELPPADSITPHTYHCMFGLMAVTGLRRSEALRLRFSDLTPDGLLIRETKYRKSRLVPLHSTTWRALERYLAVRTRLGSADDHLFVLSTGRSPNPTTVTMTFAALAREIGLRSESGRPGPRLHDLRHSMAVRALERATATDRDSVNRHILALTTYLGHGNVASTYWYLEATPALLRQVAKLAEKTHNERTSK